MIESLLLQFLFRRGILSSLEGLSALVRHLGFHASTVLNAREQIRIAGRQTFINFFSLKIYLLGIYLLKRITVSP
jgi:hypothetical protein